MAAIKVFEPSDEEVEAVKAQWSKKTPTRRQVVKVKVSRPFVRGAMWSERLGGYFPLAWLDPQDSMRAAKADGQPPSLASNPIRQFRGEPGNVTNYAQLSFGNKQPIEVRFNGRFIKGFVSIVALQTLFNPAEDAPEIDNQPVVLKPGMSYRIPAGMAE